MVVKIMKIAKKIFESPVRESWYNKRKLPTRPIARPSICLRVKNKLKKNTPTISVEIGVKVVGIDAIPLSIWVWPNPTR